MTLFSVCCRLIDDTCTIQISVSSFSDEEATWEDSQNQGKSMTTIRVALFLLLIKPCVYRLFVYYQKLVQIEYASSLSLGVT